MESMINRPNNWYNIRNNNTIAIPRFDYFYMKNSVAHKGFIAWDTLMRSSEDNTASQ